MNQIEGGIYLIALTWMGGAVYLGSKYRKKYGPLVFASDGKGVYRLYAYSFGYTSILAFVIALANFRIGQELNWIFSILLSMVTALLLSLQMMGALLIGRTIFNKNLDD